MRPIQTAYHYGMIATVELGGHDVAQVGVGPKHDEVLPMDDDT